MKNRLVILLTASILMALLVLPAAADPGTAEGKFLKEIKLEKKTVKGEPLYHYRDDIFLSFDRHMEGSEKDYGSRLFVLRVTGDNTKVIYYSKGSFDSYFLRPSFFSADIKQAPLLILAETGTEYSWGARVFLVSPDGSTRDLGSLDVAVIDDPEADTVSVIPHTRIKGDGNKYEFTFDKDVVFDPGGLDDRPVSRGQIKYIYDGISLNLINNGK
jgi:hypothetical protein